MKRDTKFQDRNPDDLCYGTVIKARTVFVGLHSSLEVFAAAVGFLLDQVAFRPVSGMRTKIMTVSI